MAQDVSLVVATGTLTVTGNFTANDTVLIGNVIYKFVASPSSANDVDLGGDAETSLDNLTLAINNSGNATGGEYADDTVPIVEVTASNTATVLTLTAAYGGLWGNYIQLTEGVDAGGKYSITKAMSSGLGDISGAAGWFARLFALNQINSEVLSELKIFTEAGD